MSEWLRSCVRSYNNYSGLYKRLHTLVSWQVEHWDGWMNRLRADWDERMLLLPLSRPLHHFHSSNIFPAHPPTPLYSHVPFCSSWLCLPFLSSPHTSSSSLPVSLYLLTSRSSASSSPLEALTCARRLQLPFHLHFLFILLWLYLLSLYAEFVFSITNSTRSSVSNDTITSLCARPTAAYNWSRLHRLLAL